MTVTPGTVKVADALKVAATPCAVIRNVPAPPLTLTIVLAGVTGTPVPRVNPTPEALASTTALPAWAVVSWSAKLPVSA